MRNDIKIMALILLIVIAGAFIGAKYYQNSVQNTRQPTTPNSALVREDSPTIGPVDAKVTLVEFYDPECESCAAFAPVIKRILIEYQGRIRLVSRHMPLHPNSVTAAAFTEAAGEQGKFWEAQELLFEKQPEWGTKHGPPTAAPPPNINVLFDGYAKELGLDLAKASASIKEGKFNGRIERDKKDGQSLGVRKTPTFFVNGRELARFSESDLRMLIDDEMKK